ncbi:MAG: hypothetical protein E7598_03195 [Ruminococcaceae bacterium]|nr:hypothetical protein [Oscillospiraceae bacterium]
MKKLFILLLTLSLLLCSCDGNPVATTEVTTTAENPTPIETATSAGTQPTVPTLEIPAVISAAKYEKPIVDMLGYSSWDYPHSVEYPKIDSDKPGAVALNEKIAAIYEKTINELKNGSEGNNIYNFRYASSVCDGVVFIRIIENTGWQYSEGMTEQKIFYYDAANDKELTAKEYAAHFGIDLEKAKENVVYTYELACSYMDDTSVMISGEDENAIYEPAPGKLFPAKQSAFCYDFDGIEVTNSEVFLYYHGQQYVLSTYRFALDRETLAPKYPHYMGYVAVIFPTDFPANEVKITLDKGSITEYSIPEDSGIYNIKISSTAITVYSNVRLDDWEISVNGGERYTAGGQMYDDENLYQYNFYAREYIPADTLKTIEFFGYSAPKVPEVVLADSVTKTAIDTLEGGDFGFTHKIEYPRIDSNKPGAEALNKKLGEKYQKIIVELMNNKEAQYLYDISYETSTYGDLIFIRMKQYTGWQYSEGAFGQEIYYYDAANDREITAEEYCERLGIDLEKATRGVLASYDLISAGYGGDSYHTANIAGEYMAPAPNEINYLTYKDFNDTVKFCGIELKSGQLNLYYSGHAYISNTFVCAVNASNYQPIRPNYAGYVMPSTDTPYATDIILTMKHGNVTEVQLPSEYGIYAVNFTSSGINVLSNERIPLDSFYVNGVKQEGGYSQGSADSGDGYSYYAQITDYVPLAELESIVIKLTK